MHAAPPLTMNFVTETHPTILNYVEALVRALMGDVSAAERALLVDEAIFFLERIANDRILLGAKPDRAAPAAVASAVRLRRSRRGRIRGEPADAGPCGLSTL